MRPNRLLCAVGIVVLAGALPSFAGDPVFTARDAQQQKAFMAAMDDAVSAARRGDRSSTKKALRRATLAAGYSLRSLPSAARCGQMAFEMPLWVMWVQAQIGDADGARQTAAYAGSAFSSLEALHTLALVQHGVAADQRRFYDGPCIFHEAIPPPDEPPDADGEIQRGEFRYRDHDYSDLRRLELPPSADEARKTLRMALPYAEAQTRVEIHSSVGFSVLEPPRTLSLLADWQREIGDDVGARQTFARMSKAEQVNSLFQRADREEQTKAPTASRTAEQANAALVVLTDPKERAMVLFMRGQAAMMKQDYERARQCFRQAATAAKNIPDLAIRCYALGRLFEELDLYDYDLDHRLPHPVSYKNAEDEVIRKDLVFTMRDAVLQMPPDPPGKFKLSSPAGAMVLQQKPSCCIWMISISSRFGTQLKDKDEALKTLEMARQMAEAETDQRLRTYYERMIAITQEQIEFAH